MDSISDTSARTASLIQTLCNAENRDIVFRFNDPISAPTEKYNGSSYTTDTLPKATLHATIDFVDVEHAEGILVCTAIIDSEELERVGIDSEVVATQSRDSAPEQALFEVRASRKFLDTQDSISREEAEQAIEEGRQEEVFAPWDGLPTVTVDVERTQRCHERYLDSDYHIQYASPTHDVGELIDIRIK